MTETTTEAAKSALKSAIDLEETLGCARCGLCAYGCPTYRVLLDESFAPRGRVALLRAVIEGKLDPATAYSARFYDCALCNACTSACPSGVEVGSLLLKARQALYEAGLAPAALQQLNAGLDERHNIAGEDNAHRLVWTENLERPPAGVGKAQAEMVYFVGCVGSLFPMSYSIPQAFVQVLDRAGADYAVLGAEEWCCGYPALISGNVELARAQARHNLEAIRRLGATQIVAACPSCYHIFQHTYPELLGEEWAGLRVRHSSEVLADLLEAGRLPLGDLSTTVTYHDPCDLGRKSGLYAPPRSVLAQLPGVHFVEMAFHHADALCCGGGGNLETNDPALVEQMSARRLAQAQDAGAQTIVTACQQCKRTLSGAARRQKARLRTVDITEIVWQAVQRADE